MIQVMVSVLYFDEDSVVSCDGGENDILLGRCVGTYRPEDTYEGPMHGSESVFTSMNPNEVVQKFPRKKMATAPRQSVRWSIFTSRDSAKSRSDEDGPFRAPLEVSEQAEGERKVSGCSDGQSDPDTDATNEDRGQGGGDDHETEREGITAVDKPGTLSTSSTERVHGVPDPYRR